MYQPRNIVQLSALSVIGIREDLSPVIPLYTAHIIMVLASEYTRVHQACVVSSIPVTAPMTDVSFSYWIVYLTWQLPVFKGSHSIKLQPVFRLIYFMFLIAGGMTATVTKRTMINSIKTMLKWITCK